MAPLTTAPPRTELLAPAGEKSADGDVELTDEELTALALAGDPVDEVPAGAVPIDIYAGRAPSTDFLPRWYMPPVMMRRVGRWQRWAVVAVVVGFLTVDLFGLCITYGLLTAA